ncbi:unnamed protein product [Urochloa humidicola]
MKEGLTLTAPAVVGHDTEMRAMGASNFGGGSSRAGEEEEPRVANVVVQGGVAGGFTGFSLQELTEVLLVADGVKVLDAFAGTKEARKAKAVVEFKDRGPLPSPPRSTSRKSTPPVPLLIDALPSNLWCNPPSLPLSICVAPHMPVRQRRGHGCSDGK